MPIGPLRHLMFIRVRKSIITMLQENSYDCRPGKELAKYTTKFSDGMELDLFISPVRGGLLQVKYVLEFDGKVLEMGLRQNHAVVGDYGFTMIRPEGPVTYLARVVAV